MFLQSFSNIKESKKLISQLVDVDANAYCAVIGRHFSVIMCLFEYMSDIIIFFI